MRRLIAAALVSACATTPALAADDRGFYIGADLGQATVDIDQHALDQALIDEAAEQDLEVLDATSEESESSFTYGLILGYQILPYLAIEASYVDIGEAEYKARGTVTDGVSTIDGSVAFHSAAKGPTLSALAILPFESGWLVYGRAGAFFANVEYDLTLSVAGEPEGQEQTQSSERFMWGVGGGYRQGPWTLRLEYQQIQNLVDSDLAGEINADRITLGAIYQF
jgi:opacity protein-like surface antigen